MSDLPPVLLGIQILLYFYPYLNSTHRPGRWVESCKERSRRLLDKISAVPQLEVFVAKVSLDYVIDFVKSGSGSELAERFEESLKTNRLSVLPRRSHLVAPSDIPVHELKLAIESGFSVITHERSEYLMPIDESGGFGNSTVVKTVEEFLEWLDLTAQPAEPAIADLEIVPPHPDAPSDRPLNAPALAPTRPASDRPSTSQPAEAIAVALSVFLGRLIAELELLGMDQQQQLAEAYQYLKQFGQSSTAEAKANRLTELPSIATAIESLGGALSVVNAAGLIAAPRIAPPSSNSDHNTASSSITNESKADTPDQLELGQTMQATAEAAIAPFTVPLDASNPTNIDSIDRDFVSDGVDQSDSSSVPSPSVHSVIENSGNVPQPDSFTNPSPIVQSINTVIDGSPNGVTENSPDSLTLSDPTTPLQANALPPIEEPTTSFSEGEDNSNPGGGTPTIPPPITPNSDDGISEPNPISSGEQPTDSTPSPRQTEEGSGSNQPVPSAPGKSFQTPIANGVNNQPPSTPVQNEDQPLALNGAGGSYDFPINLGDRVVIENFGGVGIGSNPSQSVSNEIDRLILQGGSLTADNMLLEQTDEGDLLITFVGVPNTSIRLKNFELELLDNLPVKLGRDRVGNILFNGQLQLEDAFDVINADDNRIDFQVFRSNVTTFLNNEDNTAQGRDNSEDVIHGLGGSDRLMGLSGNDTLYGGDGDDLLDGGAGDDLLYGGAGSDRFLLAPNSGTDTIYDFEVGQDKLQLAGGIDSSQVNVFQRGSNTLIEFNYQTLAILDGIQSSTLLGSVLFA